MEIGPSVLGPPSHTEAEESALDKHDLRALPDHSVGSSQNPLRQDRAFKRECSFRFLASGSVAGVLDGGCLVWCGVSCMARVG